ncbi:MAG TPA: hypothetical protein VNS81_07035 [Nocardioides sp.]|nr:hypothetical protein [Nocardioides sp.]
MTAQDNTDQSRLEAIQAVVDRVTSWQDGATEGTVAEELRHGADEVGVQLDDNEIRSLADAIEDRHGAVDAAQVLGGS